MDCCPSPRPEVVTTDRDEIRWCTACKQILSVEPRTRRAPDADDYERHLQKELGLEERESRGQPWVEAVITAYESVSAAAGLMTLELAREPEVSWGPGDEVEFRGLDIRSSRATPRTAAIVSRVGRRIAVRLPPRDGLARLIGKEWVKLEVRRRDLSHLIRNQLKVYQMLLEEEDVVEPLLGPELLPSVPPPEPAALELLGKLDPEAEHNPEQAHALAHALATQERGVALIQGPPGTGKTRLIANLARAIVQNGDSVLILAHTNVAVDNALERILRLEPALSMSMKRIGRPLKIVPQLAHVAAGWQEFPCAGDDEEPHVDAFSSVFRETPIVGMTLAMLAYRMAQSYCSNYHRFDYVIVDESSMNLLPPLACARHAGTRLVLVGDHRQLPPIVRAQEFSARPGFSMSPFERLAWRRKDLVVRLTRQYRSLAGIMDWSNRALYDSALHTVRTGGPPALHVDGQRVIGPCVWVDTTQLPRNAHVVRATGAELTPSFANASHAAVVVHIVGALLRDGWRADQIGYISPFRLQARLVADLARSLSEAVDFEAATVDAFQGREKDVMIFDVTTTSLERSHDSIQRLNVALTRARDLLVVVGTRDPPMRPRGAPYFLSLGRWLAHKPRVDAAGLRVPATLREQAEAWLHGNDPDKGTGRAPAGIV